ncbi:hypothetical protein LX99_04330 [Mucilaginibacter oryzae]|uniref:Uncharacterized protein n=1 Tax=Mucilaginibacter oryzae TaxID=468058 RepID=A0A316H2G1_9SPHI|nr:hypothetical protein [Mucilaginibacter oryzae]PWK72473.1 hypothetical protein LX99_04330 [Mucilaginibacter oryzae]
MKAAVIYKSIYVTFYRWNVKNFGHGGLPKANALFGASFLMIILLAILTTVAQLFLNTGWFRVSPVSGLMILLGATGALLLNYFVLLNSRFFKKINLAFERISKHNPNTWSVMLMICVIVSCSFILVVCEAGALLR